MARFLHAIDYGNPVSGSFIPALRALTKALNERGHKSLIVSPLLDPPAQWPSAFNGDAVKIVHTRRYFDIVPIMRDFRPDTVAVHFSGYSVPTTLFSVGNRRKIVRHVHGFRKASGGSVLRRGARAIHHRLLQYRADRIITVSQEVGSEMRSLGCSSSRVRVVPNGVDLGYFRAPSEAERLAERNAIGLHAAEPAVLFFGRDVKIKGADVLAAALERATNAPTIVCVGPEDVAGLLRPFARVIHRSVVADVRALMWACDAIAVPSSKEEGGAGPLALREARAVGLTPIASDVPSMREWHVVDPACRLIDTADADAWARALDAVQCGVLDPLPPSTRDEISLQRWVDRVINIYDA